MPDYPHIEKSENMLFVEVMISAKGQVEALVDYGRRVNSKKRRGRIQDVGYSPKPYHLEHLAPGYAKHWLLAGGNSREQYYCLFINVAIEIQAVDEKALEEEFVLQNKKRRHEQAVERGEAGRRKPPLCHAYRKIPKKDKKNKSRAIGNNYV